MGRALQLPGASVSRVGRSSLLQRKPITNGAAKPTQRSSPQLRQAPLRNSSPNSNRSQNCTPTISGRRRFWTSTTCFIMRAICWPAMSMCDRRSRGVIRAFSSMNSRTPIRCRQKFCGTFAGRATKGRRGQTAKLRPGSLFVVGDPKQAIYRFRGADVDTYLDAKRAILAQDPDAVLEIVANFRSLKQIIDFANEQFRGLLSAEHGQPGFTALQPTRLPRGGTASSRLFRRDDRG